MVIVLRKDVYTIWIDASVKFKVEISWFVSFFDGQVS